MRRDYRVMDPRAIKAELEASADAIGEVARLGGEFKAESVKLQAAIDKINETAAELDEYFAGDAINFMVESLKLLTKELEPNLIILDRLGTSCEKMNAGYGVALYGVSDFAVSYQAADAEEKENPESQAVIEVEKKRLQDRAGFAMERYRATLASARFANFSTPEGVAEFADGPGFIRRSLDWIKANKLQAAGGLLFAGFVGFQAYDEIKNLLPKGKSPSSSSDTPDFPDITFPDTDFPDTGSEIADALSTFDAGTAPNSQLSSLGQEAMEALTAAQGAAGVDQGPDPTQETDAGLGQDPGSSTAPTGVWPTGFGARVPGAGLIPAKATSGARKLNAVTGGWKQPTAEAEDNAEEELAGTKAGRTGGAEGGGAGMMPPMSGMGGAGSEMSMEPGMRVRPRLETVLGDVGTEPFNPDEDDDNEFSIFAD